MALSIYDLTGTPRIENGSVDRGAYERTNLPPSVISPASETATEDIAYQYVAVAADSESVPVIAFQNLPAWLVAFGDTLRGSPREGDKDTVITILVHHFVSHFLVLRTAYWAVKNSFADALAALALNL